jgi:hypothetical protein
MHKLKRQTTTLYPLRDQLETEAFHFMLKGRLTGQLPQNEVNKMKSMANTHQSPGILALLPKTGPLCTLNLSSNVALLLEMLLTRCSQQECHQAHAQISTMFKRRTSQQLRMTSTAGLTALIV